MIDTSSGKEKQQQQQQTLSPGDEYLWLVKTFETKHKNTAKAVNIN